VAALDAVGLNAWGVADGAPYQHVLPGCRAVVVFGSGGRALWSAFLDAHRGRPLGAHPLDEWVQGAVGGQDSKERVWVRTAANETRFVDFRPLAVAAGLGWQSRLGLVLHPRFGPWMGLRAACFTTEALEPTGPLPAPSPCVACPAPCAQVCPGAAISRDAAVDRAFDIRACARQHDVAETCDTQCSARAACPEGAEHAYSRLQQHYHSSRSTGRPLLEQALGLAPGQGQGQDLGWTDWTD
jgi:hypothetical protein